MSNADEVMTTTDRLVYMAHQIARNLTTMGEERAASALAEHLTSFWDPRMKSQIMTIARDKPERLSSIVAAAVARIVPEGSTAQPDAAQFNGVREAGHCDAG